MLIMLLLGVALIALLLVRTDLFSGDKNQKSVIEQRTEAVDEAVELKAMLEARDRGQSQGEEGW